MTDRPGSDPTAPAGGRLEDRLVPLRSGRYADAALAVATVLALAATAVHWTGLVVGGALVGALATSVPRALANGLTFGLVVLVAFAAWLAFHGALSTWLALGPVLALAVGSALGLPALAAVGVRALG